MKTGLGNNQPSGQWNGQACPAGRAGAAAAIPRTLTPEQKAAVDAELRWRLALPMSIYTDFKKLYNDAGVTIYAVMDPANSASGSIPETTDDELDHTFQVAKILGATHVTSELPLGDTPDIVARLKRLGNIAMKHQMFAAYHSHGQGSMAAFDTCFAASPGDRSNVDLGHFTASNGPELAINFLTKFHDKIASFHLKDRTSPEHCTLNLPWGRGETPILEILQLVSKNKWTMPASIEQEYAIPAGSDAVKEVANCVAYCRKCLA
jgi:sugar phosphate isomerase/epimerase